LLYDLWLKPEEGKMKKVGGELLFFRKDAGVAED